MSNVRCALGKYIANVRVRMAHRIEICGSASGCPSSEVVENSKLVFQVICLVEVLSLGGNTLVGNTNHPSIACH
jgi:hypothetical protein